MFGLLEYIWPPKWKFALVITEGGPGGGGVLRGGVGSGGLCVGVLRLQLDCPVSVKKFPTLSCEGPLLVTGGVELVEKEKAGKF